MKRNIIVERRFNCSDEFFKVIFDKELQRNFNLLGVAATIVKEAVSLCFRNETDAMEAIDMLRDSGVGSSLKDFSTLTFDKIAEFEKEHEGQDNDTMRNMPGNGM